MMQKPAHGETWLEAEQGGFDLVLMDVQMPEMDGLEATRRIRTHERESGLPRTPVLAVTAHTLDSDRALVLEAGMDDLCPKPIEPAVLLAMIQACRHGRGPVPARPQPDPLPEVREEAA